MQRHSRLQRYGIAIVSPIGAVLLTHFLWWHIQPITYPFFLAAVVISSWYGGLKPGLLSTVLAALLSEYFFLPIRYSFGISFNNLGRLAYFVIVAILICSFNARMRATQRRAERNYALLLENQNRLRESEERFRLLVEGVQDYAIFMLDCEGRFTSWNVGAERILGYQETEILGQPFSCIFTPDDIKNGRPEEALQLAIATGQAQDDRWHLRKEGTRLWAHGIVTPIRDGTGNFRGFAKILQDMTERKQAEEERAQLLEREQAARAEAEAANRAKDEFLAVVSHELRTPLTAIAGWAGMLQTGMLDEDRAAIALETIERNVTLQAQLIEDLLDISRIIRGELRLNHALVNLIDVITAAIEVVQPTVDAKQLQLAFLLGTSIRDLQSQKTDMPDVLVSGDAERLQQVVWNLLSNAVKFTPEGGQVTVRLERIEQSFAQISVSDTGIGIRADFLPYVFDRFRQADSTSTRSHKGLGLGLAIARHLVELHNGSIEAESQGEGQGATFTVQLPLMTNPEQRGSIPASNRAWIAPSSLDLSGVRVLIVDDEADMRGWLTAVLQARGAQTVAVGSVDEAFDRLESFIPTVLVSDIALPGKNGFALMRQVRDLEVQLGVSIPAIALTAYTNEEAHQLALDAGFQQYMAKPVTPDELVVAIHKLYHSLKDTDLAKDLDAEAGGSR